MEAEERVTFEESSGNVFADLGIPDADAHLVKADLASRIRQGLQERGLTQTEAARLLGTSQARVSELYNGKVAQMTYDRLLGWLNALGNDVQITIATATADDRQGRGKTLLRAGKAAL
jgi:predicted XRE-type DNA-binding protein